MTDTSGDASLVEGSDAEEEEVEEPEYSADQVAASKVMAAKARELIAGFSVRAVEAVDVEYMRSNYKESRVDMLSDTSSGCICVFRRPSSGSYCLRITRIPGLGLVYSGDCGTAVFKLHESDMQGSRAAIKTVADYLKHPSYGQEKFKCGMGTHCTVDGDFDLKTYLMEVLRVFDDEEFLLDMFYVDDHSVTKACASFVKDTACMMDHTWSEDDIETLKKRGMSENSINEIRQAQAIGSTWYKLRATGAYQKKKMVEDKLSEYIDLLERISEATTPEEAGEAACDIYQDVFDGCSPRGTKVSDIVYRYAVASEAILAYLDAHPEQFVQDVTEGSEKDGQYGNS